MWRVHHTGEGLISVEGAPHCEVDQCGGCTTLCEGLISVVGAPHCGEGLISVEGGERYPQLLPQLPVDM